MKLFTLLIASVLLTPFGGFSQDIEEGTASPSNSSEAKVNRLKTVANSYGKLREILGTKCSNNPKCIGEEGKEAARGICDDFYAKLGDFNEADQEELGKVVKEQVIQSHGSSPGSALLKDLNHIMGLVETPVGRTDFDKTCNKVIRKSFFGNSVELGNNYLASFYQASFENIKIEEKRAAPLRFDAGITCDIYGTNCPFLSQDYQENCDLFGCSIMKEGAFNGESELGQIVMQSMANARDFSLSGSDKFCTKCMKDAYKVTGKKNKKFENSKEDFEAGVKNYLAGKTAGKALLDWVGDLEGLYDLSYMADGKDKMAKSFLCENELEAIFNPKGKPCGAKGPGKQAYEKRLESALEFAGLNKVTSPSELVKNLQENIDPKGKSCREYNAFYRKYNFNSVDNRQYKGALSFLLEGAQNSDDLSEALQEGRCGSGAGEQNFPKFFSDKMAKMTVDKLVASYKKMKGNGDASEEMSMEGVSKIVAGEPFLEGLLTGNNLDKQTSDHFKGLSKNILKMFNHYKVAKEKELFVTSVFGRPDTELERFRDYLEKVYKDFYANTIEMAMKMDPAYKANLNSWSSVCDLYKKSKKDPDSSIVGLIDSQSMDDIKKKALANNDCSSILRPLRKRLCSDPSISSSEGESNKLDFSKKDLEEAKSFAFSGVPFGEEIAANSLVCEMNGIDPSQFQPTNMTDVGAGVPFALSDLEMKLKIENIERKKLGNLNPGRLAELDKELSAYKAMNKIRSNPEGSSCDSILLKDLVALQGVERVKDLKLIKGGRRIEKAEDSLVSMVNRETNIWLDEVILDAPDYKNTTTNVEFDGGGGSKGSRVSRLASSGSSQDYTTGGASNSNNDIESKTVVSGPSRSIASVEEKNHLLPESSASAQSFGSSIGATSQTPQPNYYPSTLPNRLSDKEFEEAMSEPNKEKAAENLMDKAGMSNDPEIKQMLKELLANQKEEASVEDLKRQIQENKKEAEERYADLEEKIKSKKKAIVKDESGKKKAETTDIKSLAQNNRYVLDTRAPGHKDSPVEFVDRSYYTSGPGKASISPNFSESSAPERMSFNEYSAKRRSSSSARMPYEANRINQEANRSFLSSFDTATFSKEDGSIDYESYAKKYVSHLAKSPGIIEHLVKYDSNGRPAKIRVPDPKNNEKYLEVDIPEELKDEVLAQVQSDEKASFSLYEQVQEITSIFDFMENQKKEVTSLENLYGMFEVTDSMKKQ